jgi:hypothetical protein
MINLMKAIVRVCVKTSDDTTMTQAALLSVAAVLKYVEQKDPNFPSATAQEYVRHLTEDMPMDALALILSVEVNEVLTAKGMN